MKIYENFATDDTASATVQLKAHEFQALQNYMHTPPGFNSVKFVHGVYLNYRGCGWYTLSTTNSFRAIEKIQLAIRVLRKFATEFETGVFVPSVALKIRVRAQKLRPTVAQRAHTPMIPTPSPAVPVKAPQPVGDEHDDAPPVVPPVPVHHKGQVSSLAFALLQRHFSARPLTR